MAQAAYCQQHVACDGTSGSNGNAASEGTRPSCFIKVLPERLHSTSVQLARSIFPANAPGNVSLGAGVIEPARLAVLTTKYWGPAPRTLTVSFIDGNVPLDLQKKIVDHMNAWQCAIRFQLIQQGFEGNVRITLRSAGYWSYLGTDVLLIPKNQPTMCLQGFNMGTPESEYRRVVRHETGHTLGFPHEHLRAEIVNRIDREKAYKWARDTYGWDRAMVDNNILTAVDNNSIMGTPVEVTSIMAYMLPGWIMIDGVGVPGGTDITPTDFNFCARLYPRAQGGAEISHTHTQVVAEDWGEDQDVSLPELLSSFNFAAAITA